MIRQNIDWDKIDTVANKLRNEIRGLITSDLSEEQAVESLSLIFITLAKIEESDNSAAGYLAGEFLQYVFSFSKPCVDAFYQWKDGIEQQLNNEPVEKSEDKPLDLSDCSIESLSQKLSDVMKHPKFPAEMFNCLGDLINDNSKIDFDSPENLKEVLERMGGKSDA